MPTKLAKISAYVDQELYQELKETAEANERTVSKQIVYIIKQYLNNEKQTQLQQVWGEIPAFFCHIIFSTLYY